MDSRLSRGRPLVKKKKKKKCVGKVAAVWVELHEEEGRFKKETKEEGTGKSQTKAARE